MKSHFEFLRLFQLIFLYNICIITFCPVKSYFIFNQQKSEKKLLRNIFYNYEFRKNMNVTFKYIQSLNNLMVSSNSNSQYDSFDSQFNTKTKSLSLLSDTQQILIPEDIFPFYNEIDKIIFYHSLRRRCIYSEMKEYNNIEQIKNQRILIQQNRSSKITCVMDVESKQLAVIKEIHTCQLDNAIQKLDEYKIHYKMNQKYPEQSLKLFMPVQIQKQYQTYNIAACLERAQFNLYDYSRKYKITNEYAHYILFQILQQIVNMHSINIAHRDVKPQNIFFVKDKGWLLSDFGESQIYQEVDSLYNIRGTIYFLLPSLKAQINHNRRIKQNLLFNDIYALVITIIIIQSLQYIKSIQEELEFSKDQLLKDLLLINQLAQLKIFIELKNFVMDKQFEIIQDPIYMKLNLNQIQVNQNMIYQSYISLYRYYQQNKNEIKVKFINQLLQLIQKIINEEQFQALDANIIYLLYDSLFHGFQLNLKEPSYYLKNFDKYDLEKKKCQFIYCINLVLMRKQFFMLKKYLISLISRIFIYQPCTVFEGIS
ncbi:hypothetical protein pb186bvf_001820 [Paramecium bursaria]